MMHLTPAEEEKYFEAASTFDEERVTRANKSASIAWKVAGAGLGIGFLSVAAVVIMALKFEPFVMLVGLDKVTGRVEAIETTLNHTTNQEEQIDLYFLRQYMNYRENWNWTQAQSMFDTTQIFNSPQQQRIYAAESDPHNAQSKAKLFGRKANADWQEESISFVSRDKGVFVAAIRWTRAVTPTDGNTASPAPVAYTSTVTFTYSGKPASSSIRKINPLGFQVLDYQRTLDSGLAAPAARGVAR
jgi:type IV secretion system protein VirB8